MSAAAAVLAHLGRASVAVVGDFFVDRHLHVEPALEERSLETGLAAHQVVAVGGSPGGAGNVAANLCALGVGHVSCIGPVGDDGEGWTLRRQLRERGADITGLVSTGRLTPTYLKILREGREGERLDLRTRARLTGPEEARVLGALEAVRPDACIVVDQVGPEGACTPRVVARLRDLSAGCIVIVDSRARILDFPFGHLKPNLDEARRALGDGDPAAHAAALAAISGRAAFVTCGAQGIVTCAPGAAPLRVPAPRLDGPVDAVGAGDTVAAALACALVAGCDAHEAARFAVACASVTVRKLGVTGTVTPAELA